MNRKDFVATLGLGSSAIWATGCGSSSRNKDELPVFDSNAPYRFWASIRKSYSLTPDRVYLNCGGLGPAPKIVMDAVAEKSAELQCISETGHALMDVAREVVARYLGIGLDSICFTRNATESNSIIAAGLDLKRGDEVIFESHAHPGGSLPWLSRSKHDGIRVRVFEPDPHSQEGNLNRIESLITPRTRVIQVSHITAPTGILMDVKAIARLARSKGIWFHIDGAQSAGMIPINLSEIGCDSYATSGHKWMGGPRGTGILCIDPERVDEVDATHVGGHSPASYALPDNIVFLPGARRYEYGTRNTELVEGLRVAVDFQTRIGVERIEAYGSSLVDWLYRELVAIDSISVLTPSDPNMRRSIITFKSSKVSFDPFNNALSRDYKLRCRRVTEQGLNAVRVSPHIYNSLEECARLVEAVKEIVSRA